MGDHKRHEGGLVGRHIEAFLSTPLFRFKYKVENSERELMENAVRLSGEVEEELPGGIVVTVKTLSNMRQSETELPFERIFLPYHKIDFIVVG